MTEINRSARNGTQGGPASTAPSGQVADYQLLFHTLPGLYVVFDPGLTVVAASDAFLKATLTDRDALVGRYLFDVFPDGPGDARAAGVRNMRESIARVLSERRPDGMAVQRYPISRADGDGLEERCWSPANYPVLDDSGRVVAILHRVVDVTAWLLEREGAAVPGVLPSSDGNGDEIELEIFRRAQQIQEANRMLREVNIELAERHQALEQAVEMRDEALRSSDERFRLLVHGVRDYAIYMLDPGGNITSWNPGAERIEGYREDEVLGRNFSIFYTEEEATRGDPEQDLSQAAELGSIEQRHWRVRKDGSKFWAAGVLTALYDSDRSLRGFVKVLRDLTKQRRSEVLLQSVVDTALDGIITISAEGTIQTFNRAAEAIFGYSAGEAIGHNVNTLMPEPYHREHDGYLGAYARTGNAKVIGIGREASGRRKDGSEFPLELAVSSFEQDGRTCFTGLVRDITARKKMEDQLLVAHKMDAMGQLAAGIAHDFNNMLTVISGYSDLVLRTLPDADPCRSLVREIRSASARASALTGQLLAASRQQMLEPRVLDLNEVVADTCTMLQRLIGEDIDLSTSLANDLSRIRADPGQIGQVLMNLAVNARDAMPVGGTLTIATRNVVLDGDFSRSHPGFVHGPHVQLAVTDTGTGMTHELAARIFEPFFTTKGVGHGTGLGLSVVHGIVKQSGGMIDVESEPQAGAAFKIHFPAIDRSKESAGNPKTTVLASGSETVLVVEDDRAVRDLAALALRRFGYVVLEAGGGPEAIRLLEHHQGRVDLILTDVVMPEMGGRRLAELIRERWPGVHVLLMSGYTDDNLVRQDVLHSQVGFLAKPFTLTSMVRKVREILDHAA
ncbi:MAG TPA: PAS domain S-box protein [Candidatus Binatia bacterium]